MNDRPPGLYVHIPFCRRRCNYCDFYSEELSGPPEGFFSLLSSEAGLYSSDFRGFGTLYLGGGTPSLADPSGVKDLIDDLSGKLHFTSGREVTIEVNPDDITEEKARGYSSAGINRVSAGIQSFDDAELSFLGRRHDSDSAGRCVEALRFAGFSNIGIDLIFGFQGHNEDSWRRTLERALQFSPEHISCYQMTVPKNSRFGKLLDEGGIAELSDGIQRRLFILADKVLTGNGYIHYEISNYARGEENISRHNSSYWNRTDYLGIGPSAHSYRSGKRWWNVSSVEEYCDLLEKGEHPVFGSEDLSQGQIDLEDLYLGFRTKEGVPLSLIGKFSSGEKVLSDLMERGIVSVNREFAVPTLEGFLVADTLPLLFY